MNLNFEDESKKERKRQLIKEAIRWAIEIGIVIFSAFLIVYFFISRVVMLGGSMENTLTNGQEVIVNKAAYLVLSPSRYDVIAFYQTDEEKTTEDDLITFRRVIGLPGERVQIKEGAVYINGEKLNEKYDITPMESGGLAGNEIVLGEEEYFVLGDNRNDSEDSRFRSFGNVMKENIIGRAIFKMDPFSMIGEPSIES